MFATLVVFSLALQSCAFAEAPDVRANGEYLQGQWDDDSETIAVFQGVPFATPPVGELRWRAPLAHMPRSGPHRRPEHSGQARVAAISCGETSGAGAGRTNSNGTSRGCGALHLAGA